MSLNIVQTLRSLPAHEQARLIGSAPQYIKDYNLINLLNSYDINNKKNDGNLIKQLNMFASIQGMKEQVTKWLSS
jgi:hypothetical protein